MNTRVLFSAVENESLKNRLVVRGDESRIRERARHALGHAELVDGQVRVRRDYCSTTEVHSFSAQIGSKAPLLPLQSLVQPQPVLLLLQYTITTIYTTYTISIVP